VAELVDLQADYAAWLDRRSSSLLVWRKWLLSVHDLPSSLWLPRGQRGEHLSNMDHLPGQDVAHRQAMTTSMK
jgi:hypothetical protein